MIQSLFGLRFGWFKHERFMHDERKVDSRRMDAPINERVLQQTGLKVSSLYIAQIKQKYGFIKWDNYNSPKSESAKQPKCPPEKETAIVEALKHFHMI